MKIETIDIAPPDLNPIIKRCLEETIPQEDVLPFKFEGQTHAIRNNPLRNRPLSNFTFRTNDLIFETSTDLTIVTVCTRMRRFNTPINTPEKEPTLHSISNETIANFEELNTFNSIASKITSRIEELEISGKRLESIKQVHKVFEDLLSKSLFEIANQILILVNNKKFSLSILVAFLTASFPFKNELTFRPVFFEKAEKIALTEFGPEKLGKSLFNNLK